MRILNPRKMIRKTVLFFLCILFAQGAAAVYGADVLRLGFIGDIMAHAVNFRMTDYRDIYKDVADLFSTDDLTFANLELPIDQFLPLGDYPLFNGHRDYWDAAVRSGVNVFSTANNHAFDQGVQGIYQTLRSAAAVGRDTGRQIWWSGTRGNLDSPFTPVYMNVKGFRIGFIAATEFLNQGPNPWVNVVDYRIKEAADAFVSHVAEWAGKADIFIVSYHCGVEYSFAPTADLLAFFQRLLANGVTIVWGNHPHIFQRWRVEKLDGRTCFIMPSMGNFISGMTWGLSPTQTVGTIPATGDSAVIRIEFLRFGAGIQPVKWEAAPISNYVNASREMVVGKLRELAQGKPFLSDAWTSYYAARLASIEGFLTPLEEKR